MAGWCRYQNGHMRSSKSKTQKSRYTSDNNAVWLLAGAFLIALKIWQQNASGLRPSSDYRSYSPSDQVLGYTVTRLPRDINPSQSLAGSCENHSDLQSYAQQHWHTFLSTFLGFPRYNHYVIVHCQLLFFYISYLQRKKLPTGQFSPNEALPLVCVGVRYPGTPV